MTALQEVETVMMSAVKYAFVRAFYSEEKGQINLKALKTLCETWQLRKEGEEGMTD